MPTINNLKLNESLIKLQEGNSKSLKVIEGNGQSQKIVWSSSNINVVSVDTRGNITAKAKGIADIIAKTEDGTKEGSCKIYAYKRLTNTVLGKGIDILEADNVTLEFIKTNNPVLDIDMLNASGRVVQADAAHKTEYELTSGETISDVISDFNTKNQVGYEGAFSVSVTLNYNTRSTENKTTKFIKAKSDVRIVQEYIENTDIESMRQFLTSQFEKDCLSKDAATLLKTYGSHIIANCYWGGLADISSMYTSSKYTEKQKIEAIVSASIKGFTADSSTVSQKDKDHFRSNSTNKVKTYGGDMTSTTIEEFNKNYAKWYNSLKGNLAVCGIDAFNEHTNMIPLWKFINLISPVKSFDVKRLFEKRHNDIEAKLKGLVVYTPVVTHINVLGLPNSNNSNYTLIPTGYNHAVLNDMTDRNNDTESFAEKQSIILDANKGAGGDYINIFYKTTQILHENAYNNRAISDIIMLKGANAKAPYGYTKIEWDLNAGCGKKTDYAYLAYRKTKPEDIYVIDFIGGQVTSGKNTGGLPANDNGIWEWVYKWGNGKKSTTIADLNEGAGGDYVRLVVHKIKRQK